MNVRKIEATVLHQIAMNDMKQALFAHKESLSGMEMLAIASQLVGQIMAVQDQTKVTVESALQTIDANIATGNAMAIEGLMKSQGQA